MVRKPEVVTFNCCRCHRLSFRITDEQRFLEPTDWQCSKCEEEARVALRLPADWTLEPLVKAGAFAPVSREARG